MGRLSYAGQDDYKVEEQSEQIKYNTFMTKYHHIVLFRLYDDTSAAVRREAVNRLQRLGSGHQGLTSWTVNESIDTRKGHIIIEEAVFETEADYIRFKQSQAHVAVGEFMRQIADWWVGDYLK